MTTDYQSRAEPGAALSHGFPLWQSDRSFCGLAYAAGATTATDRVTCKTCLEEIRRLHPATTATLTQNPL